MSTIQLGIVLFAGALFESTVVKKILQFSFIGKLVIKCFYYVFNSVPIALTGISLKQNCGIISF